MRVVLAVVVALALAASGLWWLAARALTTGLENWFAAQTASGRTASHGRLEVSGFPGRFALTIDAISLADPATGTGWQTSSLHLTSPSYQPWHLTATLPDPLRVQTPTATITLTATGLQADLTLTPLPSLPLDSITLEGHRLRATSSLGWQLAADHARLATKANPTLTNAHDLSLRLTDLALDPALRAALARGSDLPARVELITIDAVARFSAPLDRYANQTRPHLTGLTLSHGLIRWGTLTLTASGSLTTDALGRAEGRIDLAVENWQPALDAALALGLIRAETAPTLARALTLLALQSGNPRSVDLPLTLHAGLISLGPMPLGPAPLMP